MQTRSKAAAAMPTGATSGTANKTTKARSTQSKTRSGGVRKPANVKPSRKKTATGAVTRPPAATAPTTRGPGRRAPTPKQSTASALQELLKASHQDAEPGAAEEDTEDSTQDSAPDGGQPIAQASAAVTILSGPLLHTQEAVITAEERMTLITDSHAYIDKFSNEPFQTIARRLNKDQLASDLRGMVGVLTRAVPVIHTAPTRSSAPAPAPAPAYSNAPAPPPPATTPIAGDAPPVQQPVVDPGPGPAFHPGRLDQYNAMLSLISNAVESIPAEETDGTTFESLRTISNKVSAMRDELKKDLGATQDSQPLEPSRAQESSRGQEPSHAQALSRAPKARNDEVEDSNGTQDEIVLNPNAAREREAKQAAAKKRATSKRGGKNK